MASEVINRKSMVRILSPRIPSETDKTRPDASNHFEFEGLGLIDGGFCVGTIPLDSVPIRPWSKAWFEGNMGRCRVGIQKESGKRLVIVEERGLDAISSREQEAARDVGGEIIGSRMNPSHACDHHAEALGVPWSRDRRG